MVDMTRNTPVSKAIDEINLDAESFWRAIEVTVPDGFKDPWERIPAHTDLRMPPSSSSAIRLSSHLLKRKISSACYVDKHFPLEERVDQYHMGLVVNLQMEKIFKLLRGTPAPPG
eukprot:7352032-Karenia_brevis.AAC.1